MLYKQNIHRRKVFFFEFVNFKIFDLLVKNWRNIHKFCGWNVALTNLVIMWVFRRGENENIIETHTYAITKYILIVRLFRVVLIV